eukprot:35796-Chlamydomonas_euryale.AAC.2
MHPCAHAPMRLCTHVPMHPCAHAPMRPCTHASMRHVCCAVRSMFRVADMQKRQVVAPSLHAHLYIWGDGRKTAEHEVLPVSTQVWEQGEGPRVGSGELGRGV